MVGAHSLLLEYRSKLKSTSNIILKRLRYQHVSRDIFPSVLDVNKCQRSYTSKQAGIVAGCCRDRGIQHNSKF